MSRVIIEPSIPALIKLVEKVDAKDHDDGAASPVRPYREKKNIVFADVLTDLNKAVTYHHNQITFSQQSENLIELRNNKMKPVMEHATGCIQFLKIYYEPNFKDLGDWGANITNSGKVIIPTDIYERDTLVTALRVQHDTYPAGSSPLQPYLTKHGIDLGADVSAMAEAIAYHEEAKTKADEAENNTELRNNIVEPTIKMLRGIAEMLLKLYADNPRGICAWGFSVDDNPQKPTEQTSRLDLLTKRTYTSVKIGGLVTNLSKFDIHLYKGKEMIGDPIIIQPNKQFGVPKGYSTLTIYNPSTLSKAVVKIEVNK